MLNIKFAINFELPPIVSKVELVKCEPESLCSR